MVLLELNEIHKAYGPEVVLEDISLILRRGEKVGLIGPNGAGKTTLLRIIMGSEEFERGEVVKFKKDMTIGYLTQDPSFSSGNTLFEEMSKVFSHLKVMQKDLSKLERRMALFASNEEKLSEVMAEYGRLVEEYDVKGGYTYEHRIETVLSGLGFSPDEYKRNIETFSGGEKTRADLAKLLLQEPDLLLLDEPTNHLDISAVEWLEGFLQQYKGAVLIVSHDRYFLDKIVIRILELEAHHIEEYKGNYSYYVQEKRGRLAKREKDYELQRREIKKMEGFIRLNMQRGVKAIRQAQSRMKALERVERVERPKKPRRRIKLRFDFERRSGNDVVRVVNLSKKFDSNLLFEKVNILVRYGERVGIIGANGTGKSTLLNIIAGLEEPTSGDAYLGANVIIGHYDQEHENLNLDRAVIDEIRGTKEMNPLQARKFLGGFLFTGDKVFKKIRELSGGERVRIMLAKLMLSNVNFLMMDEPTNHLDVESREVLEEALTSFEGTILVVSHDRYFLDKIVDRIYEIDNKRVRMYLGNYTYYRERKEEERRQAAQLAEEMSRVNRKKKERPTRENKLLDKERFSLTEVENKISALESSMEALADDLNDPELYKDPDRSRQLTQEFDALQRDLERWYSIWENKMTASQSNR